LANKIGECCLVHPTHSAAPVVSYTKGVDDINALADTNGALLLPPFLALVSKSRFIITVNEATAATFIANDNNDLANPACNVLDSVTLIASKRFLNIYKVR
jgi:hypothetical protein